MCGRPTRLSVTVMSPLLELAARPVCRTASISIPRGETDGDAAAGLGARKTFPPSVMPCTGTHKHRRSGQAKCFVFKKLSNKLCGAARTADAIVSSSATTRPRHTSRISAAGMPHWAESCSFTAPICISAASTSQENALPRITCTFSNMTAGTFPAAGCFVAAMPFTVLSCAG